MPPDDWSPFESDDDADEPDEVDEPDEFDEPDEADEPDEVDDGVDDEADDGVDDWLDDDAPRPLLPSEPLLPAAELRFDEPDDDGLVLPRLPLDEALCWLPDEAVVPLFRLESWLLPMFEPDLLASMPLPSLDF